MKKIIILLILVLCLTGCKQGPYLVTNVVDGDTLDINTGERIRLSGINTPETNECYYQEAKNWLTKLTLGKEVYLEKDRSNTGKYGRLLRYIYVDDILVNEILVKEGYAKVYDKYKDDTKRYEQLKNVETKDNGLWLC
ncbi:MAG: thermonuclease family protein [archaeon]